MYSDQITTIINIINIIYYYKLPCTVYR